MATRTLSSDNASVHAPVVVWTGLLNGDDGSAWEGPDFADRSVVVTGTFGTGGSITVQGSNDGTNWFALTDPQGNAITKTAAGLEQITEITKFVRPIVTAGDGTTSLVATMYARRGR